MSGFKTSGVFGLVLLISIGAQADGILVLKSQNSEPYTQALNGFREACGGQPTEIDLAGSKSRKDYFVKHISANKPRLIVALGPLAAKMAQEEAKDIPVIFLMVSNPVRRGLKGDNIAGVSLDIPVSVQFTNYKVLLPKLRTIGVIYDPTKTATIIEEAQVAAKNLELELAAIAVDSPREVPRALTGLLNKGIDALWMVPDETVVTPESFKFLLGETSKRLLPFLAASDIFVEVGALAALTPDYKDAGRQGYDLVKAIDRGEQNLADLGTRPPAKVNLVLNMKTASKIGLRVPEELVESASKVY